MREVWHANCNLQTRKNALKRIALWTNVVANCSQWSRLLFYWLLNSNRHHTPVLHISVQPWAAHKWNHTLVRIDNGIGTFKDASIEHACSCILLKHIIYTPIYIYIYQYITFRIATRVLHSLPVQADGCYKYWYAYALFMWHVCMWSMTSAMSYLCCSADMEHILYMTWYNIECNTSTTRSTYHLTLYFLCFCLHQYNGEGF